MLNPVLDQIHHRPRQGESVSTAPAGEGGQDYAAPSSGYWESP